MACHWKVMKDERVSTSSSEFFTVNRCEKSG